MAAFLFVRKFTVVKPGSVSYHQRYRTFFLFFICFILPPNLFFLQWFVPIGLLLLRLKFARLPATNGSWHDPWVGDESTSKSLGFSYIQPHLPHIQLILSFQTHFRFREEPWFRTVKSAILIFIRYDVIDGAWERALYTCVHGRFVTHVRTYTRTRVLLYRWFILFVVQRKAEIRDSLGLLQQIVRHVYNLHSLFHVFIFK